jgi:hypothetical protein
MRRVHQQRTPLSVSAPVDRGGDNTKRYAPSVGADDLASDRRPRRALRGPPGAGVTSLLADITGVKDNTSSSAWGRVRIRPCVYISAEVSPRVAGTKVSDAEYAFAIEKRAGAHLFR